MKPVVISHKDLPMTYNLCGLTFCAVSKYSLFPEIDRDTNSVFAICDSSVDINSLSDVVFIYELDGKFHIWDTIKL